MSGVQKGVNKKITGVEPRKSSRTGVRLENVKRMKKIVGLHHPSRLANIDLVE